MLPDPWEKKKFRLDFATETKINDLFVLLLFNLIGLFSLYNAEWFSCLTVGRAVLQAVLMSVEPNKRNKIILDSECATQNLLIAV